jgi:cell division protein FtsZ
MKDAGYAHMGIGRASGKDKAEAAATQAISSPLLETSIKGARGVIINITASEDIDLDDIDLAASMIHSQAHPDVNLIWGSAFNENLQDEMIITVIATGFEEDGSVPKPVASERPAAAVEAAPSSTFVTDSVEDDDQGFYDIMALFNNKNR